VTVAAESPFGVDSEYGRLFDVLLCAPDNFEWRPTSAISRATLASNARFDAERAQRQHAEMVSAYEAAAVRCHFLDPEPGLPYQVFARDSSLMTPWGAVITKLRQPWRRGEDAAVIRFYEESGTPICEAIGAGALEGGDVMILEPGRVLIGLGVAEERTEETGARQLAELFEKEGWEARVERFPERYLHIDVLVGLLAEKLAAVCEEVLSKSVLDWLRELGFELIALSAEDAFKLGANAMSLGDGRVLSPSGSVSLNEAMRAHGLEVIEVELDMFTLGGGGAHCLAQALRREPAG
jgi:arginine deiminase